MIHTVDFLQRKRKETRRESGLTESGERQSRWFDADAVCHRVFTGANVAANVSITTLENATLETSAHVEVIRRERENIFHSFVKL